MLITKEAVHGPMYSSEIFSDYFGNLNIVVADIETTGLSSKKNNIMLGGAVIPDNHNRMAVQFFAASEFEEEELLYRYLEFLSGYDVVVTYNGQRFDLPFIRQRLKAHRMNTEPLDRLFSLDMYRVVKYHSFLPKILRDLKQKSVEAYMDEDKSRTDNISGAENISLYNIYKNREGAEKDAALEKILLHNRDDIVRLSEILKLFRNLDIHKIMYSEGIPVKVNDLVFHTEKPIFKPGKLKIGGMIYGADRETHIFRDNMYVETDIYKKRFQLIVDYKIVQGLSIVDTNILGIDPNKFDDISGWESGYLVLKKHDEIMLHEINLLTRILLDTVGNVM